MKFQSFLNFKKKIIEIIKVFLRFWFLLVVLILFLLGIHFLERGLMFHNINMLSLCSLLKAYLNTCVNIYIYIYIYIYKNFIPVYLEMSSSRDEISSRQKCESSKRHFTIDRDDFIPGRVSSRDETSRVNTLSNLQYWCCRVSKLFCSIVLVSCNLQAYQNWFKKKKNLSEWIYDWLCRLLSS